MRQLRSCGYCCLQYCHDRFILTLFSPVFALLTLSLAINCNLTSFCMSQAAFLFTWNKDFFWLFFVITSCAVFSPSVSLIYKWLFMCFLLPSTALPRHTAPEQPLATRPGSPCRFQPGKRTIQEDFISGFVLYFKPMKAAVCVSGYVPACTTPISSWNPVHNALFLYQSSGKSQNGSYIFFQQGHFFV